MTNEHPVSQSLAEHPLRPGRKRIQNTSYIDPCSTTPMYVTKHKEAMHDMERSQERIATSL